MPGAGPRGPLEGPEFRPPEISLLTSVQVVEHNDGDEKWVNGYEFQHFGCGEGSLWAPCTGDEKPAPSGTGSQTIDAFVVLASDRCSTFGWDANNYADRARRKLNVVQSTWIENQFYDNPLGLADSASLATSSADDVTPGSGPVNASTALRILEDRGADCWKGANLTIHTRPGMLGLLVKDRLVEKRDNGNGTFRYETYMGSIVVPGRGYSGDGPNGELADEENEWMYATGPVRVDLGPVVLTPGSLAEAVNRVGNEVTYFAERSAAVAFDTDCCHLAIQIER